MGCFLSVSAAISWSYGATVPTPPAPASGTATQGTTQSTTSALLECPALSYRFDGDDIVIQTLPELCEM
jgi:hypothetical protein